MIKKLHNTNCVYPNHTTKCGWRGFTLLEMILYLAILSTLVFGIASFVNLISVARVKNQTITEVEGQALQIMEIMTQAIHNAESITTPTFGQNQNNLSLLDSNNNTVEFGLADGVVTVDRGVGPVSLNNDRVALSNLEFKNLSRSGTRDIIQINFTLSHNNNSGEQLYNYSRTYVAATRLLK